MAKNSKDGFFWETTSLFFLFCFVPHFWSTKLNIVYFLCITGCWEQTRYFTIQLIYLQMYLCFFVELDLRMSSMSDIFLMWAFRTWFKFSSEFLKFWVRSSSSGKQRWRLLRLIFARSKDWDRKGHDPLLPVVGKQSVLRDSRSLPIVSEKKQFSKLFASNFSGSRLIWSLGTRLKVITSTK